MLIGLKRILETCEIRVLTIVNHFGNIVAVFLSEELLLIYIFHGKLYAFNKNLVTDIQKVILLESDFSLARLKSEK